MSLLGTQSPVQSLYIDVFERSSCLCTEVATPSSPMIFDRKYVSQHSAQYMCPQSMPFSSWHGRHYTRHHVTPCRRTATGKSQKQISHMRSDVGASSAGAAIGQWASRISCSASRL